MSERELRYAECTCMAPGMPPCAGCEANATIDYLREEVERLRGENQLLLGIKEITPYIYHEDAEARISENRLYDILRALERRTNRLNRLVERCKGLRDRSESIWFLELDEMIKEAEAREDGDE